MNIEDAKERIQQLYKENKDTIFCLKMPSDIKTQYEQENEAIETVIAELHAMQNLLDEKNEEIERLQIENEKLTNTRNWYFEHTVNQIATPEMLDKILRDKYVSKSKVIDVIKKLEKLLPNIDYRDIEDRREREYYKSEYHKVVAQINILVNLLKEE